MVHKLALLFAVLCSYRVSAFVSTNVPNVASLRRSSWLSPASTAVSRAQQPPEDEAQSGICAVPSSRLATCLRAAAAGEEPVEDFGANVPVDEKRVAVLFDFDGTIGDTETPAMEVAYWELAPYFPESASEERILCSLSTCQA